MFNGQTGAAMSTVNYDPPRGTVSSWGDTYGNRVDRFLAGTAYLDGQRPSLIMARGYYTRTVDRGLGLPQRRADPAVDVRLATARPAPSTTGQGNHQLSIADVDGDGRDEIIYGAMAIDDNGSRLWNTGWATATRMHVGDLDPEPARPGGVQGRREHQPAGRLDGRRPDRSDHLVERLVRLRQRPRRLRRHLRRQPGRRVVVGGGRPGCYNTSGQNIGRKPGSTNFLIWWDGDPVRELLDGTHIDKYGTSADTRLLTASGVHVQQRHQVDPVAVGRPVRRLARGGRLADHRQHGAADLQHADLDRPADLHADARHAVPEAIAWQNTAYNQPPHPSFFIGNGMGAPPQPNIYLAG